MKIARKYVLAALVFVASSASAGTVYDRPTPDWRASE